jgi:hypothetical protein
VIRVIHKPGAKQLRNKSNTHRRLMICRNISVAKNNMGQSVVHLLQRMRDGKMEAILEQFAEPGHWARENAGDVLIFK